MTKPIEPNNNHKPQPDGTHLATHDAGGTIEQQPNLSNPIATHEPLPDGSHTVTHDAGDTIEQRPNPSNPIPAATHEPRPIMSYYRVVGYMRLL